MSPFQNGNQNVGNNIYYAEFERLIVEGNYVFTYNSEGNCLNIQFLILTFHFESVLHSFTMPWLRSYELY